MISREGCRIAVIGGGFSGVMTAIAKPHPVRSLAWAAWIIARLGGWKGYPSERPPGPITFKHGLDYFRACAAGWVLRDVCMP